MIGAILSGKKPLVSVTRETLISAVAALLHHHRIGAVLVVEDGVILGLVSERDICAGLHTHGAGILTARTEEIMSAPVITALPTTTVAQAMTTMTDRRQGAFGNEFDCPVFFKPAKDGFFEQLFSEDFP